MLIEEVGKQQQALQKVKDGAVFGIELFPIFKLLILALKKHNNGVNSDKSEIHFFKFSSEHKSILWKL